MLFKESKATLMRSESLTNTELSSQASDSEREVHMLLENSLRADQLVKPTKDKQKGSSYTERSSSSSMMGLSQAEIDMLSKTLQKEQRSILVIKTQKESLTASLDEQLAAAAASQHPASSVSFGKLHIREFARRPGDNPGCRIGVSLTIDWEAQDEQCIDVEAYEASRPTRRDRGELNIPSETRMQMLRDCGYSRGEILQYVKMANIARGQRNRTNETLQLAGAQEFAQRFVRGVLNKSVRRSQKKKEKKLIKESMVKDQKMLVLRRQLTPEDNNLKKQQRRLSSFGQEQEKPASEQAPVVITRKTKRDSLAIVAPVMVPDPSPASEEESSETSSEVEASDDDVDQVWTPSATPVVLEVDC